MRGWRLSRDPEWTTWRTFGGRPAVVKMERMCSAQVGVWGEGFRRRVLPARRAGMSELMRMR